jgi:LacI family transcriptional regulator
MAGNRVTMEAIAQAAGVSVPTVSRVVNGRSGVSPAIRERVEHLLQQHDYRARTSWKSPTGAMVHVVFPEIDCAWEAGHLRGIEEVLHDAGVGLRVSALRDGDQLQRLRAGRTDGVILAVTTGDHPLAAALGSRNVPMVALDPSVRAAWEMPTVAAADWSGAREATAHLIALGHRRIAIITGSSALVCSRARLDGYRAALDEAGIADDPALHDTSSFEFESGFAAARRLLNRADPPTAIFASSDTLAVGVYHAARLRGLSVPDDLSVVGFDDLPGASWGSPPLTTVRQPLREMGREAARTILQLAAGRSVEVPHAEKSTTLIVRKSTAVARPVRSRGPRRRPDIV